MMILGIHLTSKFLKIYIILIEILLIARYKFKKHRKDIYYHRGEKEFIDFSPSIQSNYNHCILFMTKASNVSRSFRQPKLSNRPFRTEVLGQYSCNCCKQHTLDSKGQKVQNRTIIIMRMEKKSNLQQITGGLKPILLLLSKKQKKRI